MKKGIPVILISLISLLSCSKKEPCITCPPPPPPLDTTSHFVQWQIPDTLGAQGVIRDVWVFDRNNAWAVGEIYLDDSTGKPDMSNLYNAAQWDGSKWTLKKVTINFRGNLITAAIEGISAFSSTDIWLMFGGEPVHGDGQNWIDYDIRTITGNNSLSVSKGWGSSSSDMYFVGRGGSIAHYNGSSWIPMTSNTTVDLQDIWGIDGSHIWAAGTNDIDGHSVLLQCNGTSWTKIYDNSTQPLQPKYFGCLWTNTLSSIYLDGGGLYILTLNDLNFGSQIKTGLMYSASSIQGVNQNDIFDVTTGGEVAHYNGSSWYYYLNIQAFNSSGAWFTRVYPTSNFILIGGWYLTSYNSAPVVIRGYR
jgi:hypothetical protein